MWWDAKKKRPFALRVNGRKPLVFKEFRRAPEEIRTPDPQIRSLMPYPMTSKSSWYRAPDLNITKIDDPQTMAFNAFIIRGTIPVIHWNRRGGGQRDIAPSKHAAHQDIRVSSIVLLVCHAVGARLKGSPLFIPSYPFARRCHLASSVGPVLAACVDVRHSDWRLGRGLSRDHAAP